VAGGRSVEDDEVVARLLMRAPLPLQHLPDLPEQEEVRQARCRAREEAERGDGEQPVAEEADRRHGANEVGQKGVEVGRDRPEALFDLRLGVAAVLAPEVVGCIAPAVRGHEEDGAAGPGGERGKGGGNRRLPDAALARDDEDGPGREAGEQIRRAQEGFSLPPEKGHNRAL
jgi:hypothetical protein